MPEWAQIRHFHTVWLEKHCLNMILMQMMQQGIDSGSYEAAASLGWKPKDQEPVVEEKKRGRPAKTKEE